MNKKNYISEDDVKDALTRKHCLSCFMDETMRGKQNVQLPQLLHKAGSINWPKNNNNKITVTCTVKDVQLRRRQIV